MPFDPQYQQLLDRVFAQFESGKLAKAVKSCDQGLRRYQNDFNFLHFRGVLALSGQKFEQAVSWLRRAISVQDGNADAFSNLATALLRLGRAQEAVAMALKAVALQPNRPDLQGNLGNALFSNGQVKQAEQAYRTMLQLNPREDKAWSKLGKYYWLRDDYDTAEEYLKKAVELNSRNLDARLQYAMTLDAQGQLSKAQAEYERSLEIAPAEPRIYHEYTESMRQRERTADAERVLERAVKRFPKSAEFPSLLIQFYERTNRLQDAASVLQGSRKRWPSDQQLRYWQGKLAMREGRIDEALRIFRPLAKLDAHPQVHFDLGSIFHKRQDYDLAYRHYSSGNAFLAKSEEARMLDADVLLKEISELKDYFHNRQAIAAWEYPPDLVERASPVFLFSFPRSGTTLLDQILYGHPAFQVLEEKPMLHGISRELASRTGGYPAALGNLSGEEVTELRERYLAIIRRYTEPDPEKFLVDKGPFSTIKVGIIARLFPKSKSIFVLRHPCDVCLSCFMQNFQLHGGTIHFTTLADTVRLYTEVMSLWLQYQEVLDLDVFTMRYEDLVQDTEGRLREMIAFLGVEWHDALLDHAGQARRRGVVATASYHQVVKPIYTTARYRWLHYQKYFEPYLEQLNPYIKAFGY